MNDSFYEQFLKKKKTGADILKQILLIWGLLLLSFIGFLFLGILFTVPAIILIYVYCSYLLPKTRQEYEYALSNHYMDIALIYNKEKRKDLMSIDLLKAEIIAPENSPKLSGFHPTKVHNFTSNAHQRDVYAVLFIQNTELHKVLIEPDDRMLANIKNWSGSKFQAF